MRLTTVSYTHLDVYKRQTLSYNNEIMIIFTMDSLTEFMPEFISTAKTLIFFYDVSEHSVVGFSAQY